VIIARKGVLSALAEWWERARKGRKAGALESKPEHMTVAEKKRLTDLLPSGLRVRDASVIVERARMLMEGSRGVEKYSRGSAIGKRVCLTARSRCCVSGVKETDGRRRRRMEHAAAPAGRKRCLWLTIIAFGGEVGVAVTAGQAIKLSCGRIRGLRFRCYTRWLLFGTKLAPYGWGTARMRRQTDARHAYDRVREAQQAAIAAVRLESGWLSGRGPRRKVLRGAAAW